MGKSILAISLIAVLLFGVVSFDDAFAKEHKEPKPTKLQKECAKEPKKDNKIKPECELLELINDVDVDPRASGFFDSFFDIFASVDSFFDIFTELQTSTTTSDSFFDVFFDVELYSVDSFFDIFTELQTKTTDNMMGISDNTDDIGTIQTEIVALDLRGQSCPPNQFVVGVDTVGDIICESLESTPPPVVDCGPLDDPTNGQVSTFDTTFLSTAAYFCDSGFELIGGNTRTCQADGAWSGTAPTCTLVDGDGDGFTVSDGDCDDTNRNVHPGADEIPGDGLDNDCDGEIDEVPFVDVSGTWTIDSPVGGLRGICNPPTFLLPDGSFSVSEIIFDQRTDTTQVTFQLVVGIEGFDIFHVPQETVFPGHLYPTFDLRAGEFAFSGTFPDESHVSGQIQTGEIPFPTPFGTYTCKPIISSFAASR